jgi:hypothetical protein
LLLDNRTGINPMKKSITRSLFALAIFLSFSGTPSKASAQGVTAFTYQGQLHDSATNANGNYAMIFKLYNGASGGSQVGGAITNLVTLANGLFTVNLDFGAGAFDGSSRWLEIAVGSTNGGNFVTSSETLSPRVPVLPAPYALYANAAGLAGQLTNSSWNAAVGNYQGYNNVFGIFASNTLVMGLSPDGVLVNGNLQANGFALGQNESISDDGSGGFFLSAGKNNANLTINDLTLQGSSIQFPAQSGASILASTNGDFIFDNNVRITSLGVVRVPTPDGGSLGLTGYGFGSHTLGIDATVQANGLNLTDGVHSSLMTVNGSGFYVGGGNFTVNGPINATTGNFSGDITVTDDVHCRTLYQSSDVNLKAGFSPVNPSAVLASVVSLPITSWNFKAENARHIGPMAQDFYAAFNVGADDRHIATVDEGGVALAAIQGLNAKLEEKDKQIEALEKRLADLEALVKPSATK